MRMWETELRVTEKRVEIGTGREFMTVRVQCVLHWGRKPLGFIRALSELPRYQRERIVVAELLGVREVK